MCSRPTTSMMSGSAAEASRASLRRTLSTMSNALLMSTLSVRLPGCPLIAGLGGHDLETAE